MNIRDNYHMMWYAQSIKEKRGHDFYPSKGMDRGRSRKLISLSHTYLEKYCSSDIQKSSCSPKDKDEEWKEMEFYCIWGLLPQKALELDALKKKKKN